MRTQSYEIVAVSIARHLLSKIQIRTLHIVRYHGEKSREADTSLIAVFEKDCNCPYSGV